MLYIFTAVTQILIIIFLSQGQQEGIGATG
jgi:hypothetical protein